MDGLYLPDGRQLALIDRDWILDELPHLGNPDDNSDANYLLASAAAATSGTGVTTGSSAGRGTTGIGTGGGGSSHAVPNHTGGGSIGADSTGANHHGTSANHNHSLLYNPDEFEGDLTLLSEIVDETQNKWSDFGLNQLLTPYARSIRPAFKRYFLRYSLYCSRRPRLNRIIKILSIIIIGFLFMTLINGVLFSSVLFLQENPNEPDYDLDTRPYYKTIEMKKRFDDSGNYLIIQNFVQYQTNLSKNADLIALNLHTDIEQLHLLLQHAKVWDGPISLSLYVKGARGSDDIDYASIWLRCNRRSFKVLNVHLVISAKAYKSSISNQHNSHSVKYAVSCQHITYVNHTDETDSTPYPSNLLRNVARNGNILPSVKYILTLDIDIFPSADLFHHLVSFYTKKTNTNEIFNRTLYVIPAFEIHINTIKRSIALPQNKRELILLWNDEQIQPFQKDICSSCQFLTNYKAWKEETKSDEILPIFRPHYSQPWKPYYVGPIDVPMFDSRFKAHAHARISQCCESFMAGYDFAVLNNVYVYRLGFLDKSQLPNTKLIEDDTSLLLFQQFQEDLLKRYSNTTRKC
ncbi:unnamed protein product [Rotaria sp. Silwood1]|nr:unnamed protein product [Rotaria sp. Silwood1]CAF1195243.1 unnamed protein product [Rotaria sp. Silwood1]CAF3454705.1 unnamed protein product [Rotaria sp. Silwood1]CAF3468503.1 unnamed protein product [Rotaria sp. Silwood1]CAF4489708.1 unnamed protein product [Rotaria sp. Silwood1]